ncbi:MAG TPA: MFS transporter [Candidatus Dormibacteraeota bacterium]|nr:MFS transporter [Candidatus Dormibacteraeota bacterium]
MLTPPRKLFYGWWVVLTAAIGLLLGYAPIFVFSFGVFVKSFVKEFHSSRTQISLAFTLANIMVSVGCPLAGRLADRFDARRVILPATLIFSFLLISFQFVSTSLWQLYLVFLALGLAGSATAPVPYLRVVSNWFDRRRGLALGLSMAGLGTGAIVMPPVAQRLITLFGWRSAYAALSILGLTVAIPMVALFLKDSPEEKGLLPDGGVDSHLPSGKWPEKQGLTWAEARGGSTFWWMLCAFSLVGASVHACVIHLVSLLTDHGVTSENAALASSALGIALLLGRVGSGYVLDRFFAPYVAIFFFSGVACGLTLLWIGAGGASAFVGASLVGLGMGAEGDLIAYFTSRYFGLRSFGEIYGYLFSAFTLSGALGPLLMAIGFDRAGSYRAPLLFFLIATIAATVLMTRLGEYRYRPA